VLSFAAANFWDARQAWAFTPLLPLSWESCSVSIQNTEQTTAHPSVLDAATNAPYLTYNLSFDQEGVYDLWGRAYTDSSIFWEFDGDTSDMREGSFGSYGEPPEWTKFGSFYTTDGVHTFSVYMGDRNDVILDQWYFTTNRSLDQDISSTGSEQSPLEPLSTAPFNTLCMTGGYILDVDPTQVIGDPDGYPSVPTGDPCHTCGWLSSKYIMASGGFNYLLRNFSDKGALWEGIWYDEYVDVSFTCIGGSNEHFASWDLDFVEDDDAVGSAFISDNYGETYSSL